MGGTDLRGRSRIIPLLLISVSGVLPSPAAAAQLHASDAAVKITTVEAPPTLAERLATLRPGGVEAQAQAVTQETAAIAKKILDNRAAAAKRAARARARLKASRAMAVPAYGRITASFGSRGHWSTRHTGMDIRASYGARVHSVVAGRVIRATYDRAYGRIVVVRGRGVDIWYAHLSRISVRVGQQVKTGQTVGRVGNSGHATGTHLHIEVRKNDRPTNPATFLWGSHRGKAGDSPSWARHRIATLSSL